MKTRLEKMDEFYRTLNVENLDIPYHANEDHESYDDFYSAIEEGEGFNVDIIYYHTAIKFLAENDSSLRQSLEIASEFGYEVDSLNSEILASLLASQTVREDFAELRDEIEEFFEELNETHPL